MITRILIFLASWNLKLIMASADINARYIRLSFLLPYLKNMETHQSYPREMKSRKTYASHCVS